MMRYVLIWCCALIVASSPATAQESWKKIGYGRLITNDLLGDGKDRYQSGSYVASRMYRQGGVVTGVEDAGFGEVLEFRVQADVKSPANLRRPAPGDRPFAGSLSFGAHTHFKQRGFDMSLGTELVFTGEGTQLSRLQTALHDALGVAVPSAAVTNAQVANGVHLGSVLEIGRQFSVSDRAHVRPFVEGRAGVENLLRVGVDLNFGQITQEPLMVRDGISGQRYRTLVQEGGGVAFTVGFDTAYVDSSIYLPASRGLALTDHRDRARMGMHWQRSNSYGFFGVTWLGKEFKTQSEPQVVGSVRLGLNF